MEIVKGNFCKITLPDEELSKKRIGQTRKTEDLERGEGKETVKTYKTRVRPQGLLRGFALYGGDVWNVVFYTE